MLGFPRFVLPLTIVIAVGCFCWSVASGDPEIFRRSGAGLLSVGALLVFLQFRGEREIDKQLERARVLENAENGLPTERLAAAISRIQGTRIREGTHSARTHLVAVLAVLTATGEAIHGFGDLLAEAVIDRWHATRAFSCSTPQSRSFVQKADLPPDAAAALGAMAERGQPFHSIHAIGPGPELPVTRFIAARQQGCRLTIRYERGGIAHTYYDALLERSGDRWIVLSR